VSPYVDLKPAQCMYCTSPARAKIVFVKTGLYVEVCEDHLKEFANNLVKEERS